MNCNLKVLLDAFLEVYHLKSSHADTVDRFLDYRGSHMILWHGGHSFMLTPNRRRNWVDPRHQGHAGNGRSDRHRTLQQSELQYLSEPGDTGGAVGAAVSAAVARDRPEHATGIDLVLRRTGVDGQRPDRWDECISNFNRILNEDLQLAERIQESVTSPGFRGMPLNYQERCIYHWHAELDRRISVERVPETPARSARARRLANGRLDMSERGILAYGAYVPRRRLSRKTIADAISWVNPALKAQARGERAICAWDEDSLTMAVEAARDCGMDNLGAPETLVLASTTLPFADRDNAAVVVEALDLPEAINTLDVTSSQRAGTAALANALEGTSGPSLIIASERRETRPASPLEMQTGHAAAAMMIGSGDRVLARCFGHRAVSRDLVDHYRARAERFDHTVENRWVRDEGFFKIIPDAVGALLEKLQIKADSIDHAILQAPARVAKRLCKMLGFPEAALVDDLSAQCGYTGAAQPLLLLVAALEQAEPGARILVAGFGQGADAMVFETTDAIADYRPRLGVAGHLERRTEETSYIRYLSQQGLVEVDWGGRAEFDNRAALTAFYRKRDMVTGFKGGRCEQCGTLQFPRAEVCVNPDCRAFETQTPVSLSGLTGRVKSFTEDWLAHSPNPPLIYGNIELKGGVNIQMEFTDCVPGSLKVGTSMEMRFRIKEVDQRRAFTRYFWKPTPVEER